MAQIMSVTFYRKPTKHNESDVVLNVNVRCDETRQYIVIITLRSYTSTRTDYIECVAVSGLAYTQTFVALRTHGHPVFKQEMQFWNKKKEKSSVSKSC